DPVVVLEVFGDRDLPRKLAVLRVVDRLQEEPALGNVRAFIPAVGHGAANVERRVESQPVGLVVPEPHHRVVAKELANLGTAEVGTVLLPEGARGALVVVEIDAAVAVLAPAVELPEAGPQPLGAEVVVDDVED